MPLLKTGSLPWTADLAQAADALRKDLAGTASEAFEGAVAREVERRALAFFTGLQAYRAHPYRRNLGAPPTVWQEGTSRLLDYRPDSGHDRKAPKGAETPVAVLVVPSLINRAYILDLNARTSLLRWLADRGVRPFLMDWGRPGVEERGLTLSDYVAGRLDRALDHVLEQTGRKPHLLGYCMGGLLALALAARRGQDLRALALLATPWDFHAEQAAQARLVADSLTSLTPLMALQGELPVDVIQGLFASL
ncbi:MAG: alpha/beta fold hydrolase, partial [Kiloniellales bacterium]|nr:alpha/beta fold hydrolase [Kiloniellales bacterium]